MHVKLWFRLKIIHVQILIMPIPQRKTKLAVASNTWFSKDLDGMEKNSLTQKFGTYWSSCGRMMSHQRSLLSIPLLTEILWSMREVSIYSKDISLLSQEYSILWVTIKSPMENSILHFLHLQAQKILEPTKNFRGSWSSTEWFAWLYLMLSTAYKILRTFSMC